MPTNIDFSFLSSYYAAKSATRSFSSAQAAELPQSKFKRQTLPEGVVPPWEKKLVGPADTPTGKLRAALEVKNFINLDDATFNKTGVSKDHKKLFALYKGMHALQELATRAGDEKTSSGERTGLAKRFAAGYAEVKALIKGDSFDDLTLLFGDKDSKAKSELAIPRNRTEYKGNLVVSGTSDTALSGVTGTEVITINVSKAGGTTPVSVDLSEITGTVSIDSIVTLLNDKLATAGMLTRFKKQEVLGLNKDSPKQYGFAIQGVATEKISLSASNSEAALYVAGNNGVGDGLRGQITKLSNLNSAAPVNVASEKVDPKTTGTTDARATATDAQGNVFVVGTATGDLGSALVQGDHDVYLRKYDSANNLVWSRMLGASDKADAYALAIDSDGNAIVAGRVTDKLSQAATGGNGDSFVSKYDSAGLEVFTRQIGSVEDDQINAVAVDASGNIYLGGQTKGKMTASADTVTGTDAFVQKLSSTGSLLFTRQFGSGSDERIAGLAIADDGNLITSSIENGSAVVRKLDANDGVAAPVWEVNLGSLNSGSLGGLKAANGAVYISGTTQNGSLTAGGQANVVTAISGGTDAFVFKLTDSGANAAANFVTYVGSSGAESGGGLTVTSDAIYLAGSTRTGLVGQSPVAEKSSNGFVAKLDLSGAAGWTYQFAGSKGNATAVSVSADTSGASVLDALGLPRGQVALDGSRLITAQSTVRPGDYFSVQVNDQTARKVSVRAGDTLRSIASRINLVLGLKGEAEVSRGPSGDGLQIKVNDDSTITLKAGEGGFDALAGFGLTPGVLFGKDVKLNGKAASTKLKEINSYAMRLADDLSLLTETNARRASSNMAAAIETIKQVSQRLIDGPPPPKVEEKNGGPAPAYLGAQISNYQIALAAFGGGTLGNF